MYFIDEVIIDLFSEIDHSIKPNNIFFLKWVIHKNHVKKDSKKTVGKNNEAKTTWSSHLDCFFNTYLSCN